MACIESTKAGERLPLAKLGSKARTTRQISCMATHEYCALHVPVMRASRWPAAPAGGEQRAPACRRPGRAQGRPCPSATQPPQNLPRGRPRRT
eukprot:6460667-Prymnesium_polylepis.1